MRSANDAGLRLERASREGEFDQLSEITHSLIVEVERLNQTLRIEIA